MLTYIAIRQSMGLESKTKADFEIYTTKQLACWNWMNSASVSRPVISIWRVFSWEWFWRCIPYADTSFYPYCLLDRFRIISLRGSCTAVAHCGKETDNSGLTFKLCKEKISAIELTNYGRAALSESPINRCDQCVTQISRWLWCVFFSSQFEACILSGHLRLAKHAPRQGWRPWIIDAPIRHR